MQNNKKCAFTMNELIAVCIILGVIAIITIPSFFTNTSSLKIKTTLKQGANLLAHVVNLATQSSGGYITPEDSEKLMNTLSKKLSIKYYVNCNENECTTVFDNPQIGYWMINEDNIGYRIEQGSKNCADAVSINTSATEQEAIELTCMSIIIDAGCMAKAKTPEKCKTIPDDIESITSNHFEGTQMRVFMSKKGIAFGNEETVAAGIIMAE